MNRRFGIEYIIECCVIFLFGKIKNVNIYVNNEYSFVLISFYNNIIDFKWF